MADMNLYLVVMITILMGIGLALILFGWLITATSALGSKRTVWGISCFLLMPLAFVYILIYWQETQFSRKYLLIGLLLCFIGIGCAALLTR